MKKNKELTQDDMAKFVEKYLQGRMDSCHNNEEYEQAEKACKYFREIMDREEKPLEGLTLMECIDKMYRKLTVAWGLEHEVWRKCDNAIIERTKYFDPNQCCGDDEWSTVLPFALRVTDKENEDICRNYIVVKVKRQDCFDYLYLERFDDNDKSHEDFIGWEERVVSIYKDLYRMGYFDPKYENDFME